MICPKCAAYLPDGAKFCTNCGTNLAEALAEQVAAGMAPAETSEVADLSEAPASQIPEQVPAEATSQIPEQVPVDVTTPFVPQGEADFTTPFVPQGGADYTAPITPADVVAPTEQFPYATSDTQLQSVGYDASAQTGSFYAQPQSVPETSPYAQPTPQESPYGQPQSVPQASPYAQPVSQENPYAQPVVPGAPVPPPAAGAPTPPSGYAQASQGVGQTAAPQYQQYPQSTQQYADPYPKEPKQGGKGKLIGIIALVAVLVFGIGGFAASNLLGGSGSSGGSSGAVTSESQSEAMSKAEEARKAAEAELESQKAQEAAQSEAAQAAAEDQFAGVWRLVSYVDDGEEQDLSVLNQVGMYCDLTLALDGTASLDMFGDSMMYGTWRGSSSGFLAIYLDDMGATGGIDSNGYLTLSEDDDALVFSYYSEAPSTIQAASHPSTVDVGPTTRS